MNQHFIMNYLTEKVIYFFPSNPISSCPQSVHTNSWYYKKKTNNNKHLKKNSAEVWISNAELAFLGPDSKLLNNWNLTIDF